MNTEKRDLIILGGGVGGLVVASVAGQLGLKVTLIEKSGRLGGDCLHYGCVPSKTLIRSANVAHLMRRAEFFGLPAQQIPKIDLARVNARVHSVIDRIQAHDDPQRFRGYGVDVRFDEPRFIDRERVRVGDETLIGRRFVIATGSGPMVPPIPGLEEAGYVTNESVFDLRHLPRSLVVMGGGPIGLELAQAFLRLGSRVALVEALPRLLPNEELETADTLTNTLKAEGMKIHTGAAAQKVSVRNSVKIVHCKGGIDIPCDQLLVAVGRKPNVDGLGLENTGLEYSGKGIKVDDRMRTTLPHIYAVGDVTAVMPFTHVAEYQAGIVISNAIFRFPKKADYRTVPWVIYTDPELARVGQTGKQARDAGLEVETVHFDFQDVDRALTEGSDRGFVKLTVHKGRVIGATALGPHAGELIHELALAMRQKIKLRAISELVHAYPTLAQINRRAANAWLAPKLFSDKTKAVVGWINRLLP